MELPKHKNDGRGYMEQGRVVLEVGFHGGGIAGEVSKYVL